MPQPARVTFDDGEAIEVTTARVVAANGRYFGGGMMIAPDAKIDDGLLDALVYRAEGKVRMVRDFNLIYRGAHNSLPRVTIKSCRSFTVEPFGNGLIVEAEGESPGRIPAKFWFCAAGQPTLRRAWNSIAASSSTTSNADASAL